MFCYQLENFSFTYPGRLRPALQAINLTITSGEFVVLCGPSGCGKTTLLRQLKPILAPHGRQAGRAHFAGQPLTALEQRAQCAKIGFVLQSPEDQVVTDKVWHELAFGLESLGLATATIRRRVAEMASFFGIQTWFHKSVTELSGGQKQLLALASIMVMQPEVLILDEPTSQLDPIAAGEFLANIGKINRELGITVIMTEHRLEEVFPFCDRVLVMTEGCIISEGTPAAVGQELRAVGHSMFQAMPAPMRIWASTPNDLPCPVTVRDGRFWVSSVSASLAEPPQLPAAPARPVREIAISLSEVWFRYDKGLPDVIRGLNLEACTGEVTAILGGNGTGKTTALSLIAGLQKPQRGKINLLGKEVGSYGAKLYQGLLGVLPQNPQALFLRKTLREDLQEMLPRRLSKAEAEAELERVVRLCHLTELLESHPYDLSGGEQQRAALAKILLLRPRVLLLDEPTKGLDAGFKLELAVILKNLAASGTAVVMVSHDVEFCAEHADYCLLFFDGAVVAAGTPRDFFAGNTFYTSGANRMARHVLPQAVTASDVILALGGDPSVPCREKAGTVLPRPSGTFKPTKPEPTEPEPPEPEPPPNLVAPRWPHRTIAAALIILLVVPLTIFVGMYFFGDRKYYFISLLIILETMLPFVLVFEGRRPEARELVVIAVLTALAVAGRAAFFMLPQFKPVVALVIIAGVAFGGEAGFLVGALTGFVSNIFFGQGPWTPWQMFAFGIIGFLAGVLFRQGILQRRRLALCLYGGFATFIIYGGLMNPFMVLQSQSEPTGAMFLAAYLQGIPFDLVHGAATVFFLWLFARPLLEKLDRIKLKYGL
jgi:energy-coupling factor transporter ATP-binding protein EcfA2/uncharacterized membrane protein